MCLIGVKETYVQEKKKVTKNFLGQICTTVSGLNMYVCVVCFSLMFLCYTCFNMYVCVVCFSLMFLCYTCFNMYVCVVCFSLMFLCHRSRCRMSVPPNTPSCPKASCHPHQQGVYPSTNHPPGSMGYPWWTPCIHLERESLLISFWTWNNTGFFSINAVIHKIGSLPLLSTSTYSEVCLRLRVGLWG